VDEDSPDAAERRAERRFWERYGTVRVSIEDPVYDVGVVIGVPPHLRGTARAAGGDMITPYLSAWYIDATDWACAPSDRGRDGVPQELASTVLETIIENVRALWREYEIQPLGGGVDAVA